MNPIAQQIKIEKNIPVPPVSSRVNNPDWGMVLKQLEVGDSFLVRDTTTASMSGRLSLRARLLGLKLTMRAIDDGKNGKAVRVWRIQ